jgi:low affinity Fe/Cu permease
VIAFLLIALLQNTERRNDRALHRKLDTLAVALADSMAAEGDKRLQESIDELRAVVSLEKQI